MGADKHSPPRIARRFLLLFLREEIAEEVLGDLDEKFKQSIEEKSVFRARLNYWYQVINYLRPFALRRSSSRKINGIGMLKNYFVIGWRNLIKHRTYSAINIGGFALGIAACMLLALYIKGELSYDSFYKNQDRIYRVVRVSDNDGAREGGVYFSHPVAQILRETFPEIERSGHYSSVPQFGAGNGEVRRTDRLETSPESRLVYMDQGLLDVLGATFIAGNPSKALNDPHTMVITRSIAEKYFGEEDPIGKSLIINNEPKRTYTITGVIEDFPSNSHINFELIMTLTGDGFWKGEQDSWCCQNYIDYVLVREDADVPALESKLRTLVDNYMMPEAEKNNAEQDHKNWIKNMTFKLQPVSEIYLNLDKVRDGMNHGDVRFIWLFGSIAVFILFLACINFINLSTARAATRAKEVGIRKVVGSMRSMLIRQFLAESSLFSVIAVALGTAITVLTIPAFNHIVDRNLSFPWTEPLLLPGLLGASLVIGLIAGIYPSFYLSAFLPAKVLKGTVTTGRSRTTLRSTLVIFQFTISACLIIGTIVVSRQINYLLTKQLGFDKEQVLILEGTTTLFDNAIPLKEELTQLADVEAVTISGYLPVEGSTRNGGSHWTKGHEQESNGQQWSVDADYVKTLGLKIVEGRDFSNLLASDSDAIIINQKLAKQLQLKEPIGQTIGNYYGIFTVVGVVEDFHFESLKRDISPLVLIIRRHLKSMAVRVKTDDMAATIENITGVWKKFSPNQPIRINFLDDQYERTYEDVMRFGKVVTIFATLAIVVAGLGLLGLSAFLIQQRSKEISIRLVLGASISSIFGLLTRNFVVLVLISFAIAVPLAWFMMDLWLQDYAYKIPITWDVFAITGIAAVVISLVTVSYQSLKASMANPVSSLKSE